MLDVADMAMAPRSIEAVGAEIAKRRARLDALAAIHQSPAEVAEDNRLFSETRDLEQILERERPRNAREALVIAAVAFGKARDIDEVGGVLHTEAFHLVARLVDYLEAEAGVTAAELGLGCYAAGRDNEAPTYGVDDDLTRETMQFAYDKGYLAAVARHAPTFYPFVKREIERARAADTRSRRIDQRPPSDG